MSLIRKDESEILPMSTERAEQIKALSDKDIDYSDISELDEDFFKSAERIEYPINVETITIKVKPHVLKWFKAHAKEKEYETLINDILESYIDNQQ